MAIFYQAAVKETINGTPTEVVYDLAPGNYYGTCTSQAANQNKAVSVSSDQYFILKKGIILAVKFDADNTYNATTSAPVKLNVNSTGNVQIYAANTATPTGTAITYLGRANYVNYYIYDGTYWVWAGSSADNNSTYTPQSLGFGYATCSTAASTAAKEATLTDYNLLTNGIVAVKFTNAVPANATLNVNSKGAKNIWYKGANIVANIIKAGDIATFIYDGTRYQLISIDSGNGLPDEVITYEQFSQKTDAEKEVYTGYISGWPGSGGGGGSSTADNISYDNTDSGLTANNVQDAIDEVNDKTKINYSTTEHVVGTWIDGKPLYEKTVSCGALPASGEKEVSLGINDSIDYIWGYDAFAFNPSTNTSAPLPFASNSGASAEIGYLLRAATKKIVLFATDRSDFTESYVTVRYTKATS